MMMFSDFHACVVRQFSRGVGSLWESLQTGTPFTSTELKRNRTPLFLILLQIISKIFQRVSALEIKQKIVSHSNTTRQLKVLGVDETRK